MKIRTKMSLLSSLFLIVMIATITAIVAYSIIQNAKPEIERYRVEEINRIKAELKDKVDMVYELIDSEYNSLTSKAVVEKHFGRRVKNVVESAQAIVEGYQKLVDEGALTLEEAQQEAKTKIAQLRYDDGVGYVWINDTKTPYPRMIMHPTIPSLDGKLLDSRKWDTAKGKYRNLFVAAVKLTQKQDNGFVEYEWPKPTKDGKLTEMQPKVSYVSLYKPWGWILGSGVYIDDVQQYGVEKVKDTIASLRYDDGEGYFFITSDTQPYPTMVLHPIIPSLNGSVLDDFKWGRLANNKTEHLFSAIVNEAYSQKNGGFVDYVWHKPTGDGSTQELLPKTSYVRRFTPLNWVIGSGVYTDAIEKNIQAKQSEIWSNVKKLIVRVILVALAFLLVSFVASYLFAKGLSKSLEELTSVAREISLGKGLDTQIESVSRKDEVGQLARAIERLQTSITMMMKRMKK